MNLTLSEEQRLIRESADSVLADLASSTRTRVAMASIDGHDTECWRHLAGELGWCAIPISETHGGLGLGAVELVQLFEAGGQHLLCAPYFATVALAVPILNHLGSADAQQQWLPSIASGALRASAPMPVDAGDDWRAIASGLHARVQNGRWRISGRVARIVDGASAELLLLPAHADDGELVWIAVRGDARGLQRTAVPGWDLTRRFAELYLHEVEAQRIDAAPTATAAASAAALMRLCLAAEQLGGAQACLDLTVAYSATRQQFGRSIAGFQAVKHRCAEMMVGIEALRSMLYGAAALFAEAPHDAAASDDTVAALALAKDTYFRCAQEAIQLHGGVGFTWEYDPQLHLKRAQAGSHWMGTASALRERLAARVFA